MSNRFNDRLRRQAPEGHTVRPEPGGLAQQARDAQRRIDPTAPPVPRRTFSSYDSRPVGSVEFAFTSVEQQGALTAEQTTLFQLLGADRFTVPRGRLAVLRRAGYAIDPVPGINGVRADHFRFSLLIGGAFVPHHAGLVLAPWMEDLEIHALANEGEPIGMQVTYAGDVSGVAGSRVNFLLAGQLLIATGEPLEQLVGHLR